MTEPSLPETGVPTCYRHPDRETYIRCQRCERPICPDCMRDAAVGFQCPTCVAEGAKATRAGRTAYGGRRSDNPAATTIALIGINVAVWAAIFATGGTASRLFGYLALSARGVCEADGGYYPRVLQESVCSAIAGTTWSPGVADGAVWQLVTSMFTHAFIWHIAVNMLALYSLGPQLEAALGRWRFLALYFLSGLAGSALVLWSAAERANTHGASGAIFGLMGALLVVAVKVRGDYQSVLRVVAINAVITLLFVRYLSWQGHLGGFLGGVLVAVVLVYAPRGPRRTAFQVAGLVVVAGLLAAAMAVRAAALT